ncbi:MAG: glycosyltransferase [Candidatus Omnitrophica bacterium]|nr:glycosyltransferase [Candidatus Omnitrophota bacterium]
MNHTTGRLRCDVILVSWNNLDYTRACLESLLRSLRDAEVDYHLLIVDNASKPEVIDALRAFQAQHPRVELLCNEQNFGWVRAVNQGIRWSTAPFVCWLNNDLVLCDGWLSEMLRVAAANPRIGLLNPSWKLHHETPAMFQRRVAQRRHARETSYREVGECNGACLLVRRDVIERIGLLDEVYATGGMDDSDFSRRAALAGFLCVQATGAFVYHWENVTINTVEGYWRQERPRTRQIFEERWGPPRHLAVVCDEQQVTDPHAAECFYVLRGLARLGIHLHLFVIGRRDRLRGGWTRLGIEHANLKVSFLSSRTGPGIARLQCAALFASYRGKSGSKRLNGLIVLSARHRRAFERSRWLHGLPVFGSFATCPAIARELDWYLERSARQERLAVVVIAKNEARQLADCLKTVAWADERIVVDDESTDETVPIAQSLGARVVSRASHGDFDTQRNLGMAQATSEWILQMDADERVPAALRREIQLLLGTRPAANAFQIRRHNWFLGHAVRYGGWNDWGTKFFRRAAGRYVGHSVHETLRVEGTIGRCEAPVEHYPYQTLAQVIDRTNFYSSVESAVLDAPRTHLNDRELLYHLLVKPVKIFWKLYVKKQAYREGTIGLLFSILFSWSHWLTWAKYWERHLGHQNPS